MKRILSSKHTSRFGKSILSLILILAMVGLSILSTASPAYAAQEQSFNYTITATGTEDITTYPDQEFDWSVTTYGTETWQYGFLRSRQVAVWGYDVYQTYYLHAPQGTTITSWDRTVLGTSNGGRDAGTLISGNKLIIRIYSGGMASWWGWNILGSYEAIYRIYDYTTRISSVMSVQSGSRVVNATEGDKFISSLGPLAPQHGGTVEIDSRELSINNPNVTAWMSTDSVMARTDYSEMVTQPWSDTESGSASVKISDRDKLITASSLVAPNDDTIWSVTSDNACAVETWMEGNKLYARMLTVSATIDINPETLNLKSKGKYITAYIRELPEGYTVEDIDIGTVQLMYGDKTLYAEWGAVQDNEVLMVKFNWSTVAAWFDGLHNKEVELTVIGEIDGCPPAFEGTATIRVINPSPPRRGR